MLSVGLMISRDQKVDKKNIVLFSMSSNRESLVYIKNSTNTYKTKTFLDQTKTYFKTSIFWLFQRLEFLLELQTNKSQSIETPRLRRKNILYFYFVLYITFGLNVDILLLPTYTLFYNQTTDVTAPERGLTLRIARKFSNSV